MLTQYQPLALSDYIGSGQPWDLDRNDAGVHVLPPYQQKSGADWYKGTANAIYQNLAFIERYDPEYVLILSGDHIYKMDYSAWIKAHKENNADCTIAVIDVPIEEASRFGIMNTDDSGRIVEFEEKPKNPKSTNASMGIYLFNRDVLREYLIRDENTPGSANDFGKNIIPAMLNDDKRLFAYRFSGYWKDVGTIKSLWDANMDLLNPQKPLDVWNEDWKIYSRTPALPPHRIGAAAHVDNSIITEGCKVDGTVENSVLFAGVTVKEGALIDSSILMPGAVVEPGAEVHYSIVAENVVVKSGAVIGKKPEECDDVTEWGVAVVAEGLTVGANSVVGPKAMVREDVKEGETV